MLAATLSLALVVSLASAAEICPKVFPIDKPSNSAEGIFYLIYASTTGNLPLLMPCGFFNSSPKKCSCITAEIVSLSDTSPPDSYLFTVYGLPIGSTKYQSQQFRLDRIDPDKELYQITLKGLGLTKDGAVIGTDNYENYVSFMDCGTSLLIPSRELLLSRQRNPPDSQIQLGIEAFDTNTTKYIELEKMLQPDNCPPLPE